jgi:hypothetical protein
MSHVTYPDDGMLSSKDLALLTGFDRRHIPRKAEKGEIPGAQRTKGGHWIFPVTHELRGWICFFRVRRSLLRNPPSRIGKQMLKDWGTEWRYALQAYYFCLRWPHGMVVDCGDLGVLALGVNTTWETVEAVVVKAELMPRRGPSACAGKIAPWLTKSDCPSGK